MDKLKELADRYCDSLGAADALYDELLVLFKSNNNIQNIKIVTDIWNASKKYTLQELGEICQGDVGYVEDLEDLETIIDKYCNLN